VVVALLQNACFDRVTLLHGQFGERERCSARALTQARDCFRRVIIENELR
jgi:hypothetical protein